ncbi:hypothetical protein [Rhodopirellula bahusiensis]|uniref:Uncharacterized protein n=1 Tax=Rhodopirellula bahusiensis TaxID=2014065 RepID=A0A2G1W0I4_9BACT|nr:hypothetical protein [Rhodopirellula bahusiensis]PHQ32360.1 hypothetical protein CEE69_26270 [Rhodopirellula bahusiensis]
MNHFNPRMSDGGKMPLQRRKFMTLLGGGSAALALTEVAMMRGLPPVSAAEAKLDHNTVRFSDDIEPLVRLLEDTPRKRVVQAFADKIRSGTSYREVLTALLLAGVRNVQPRPAVGFKFHAVLVVNSAHLASLGSPDEDRWLPIFWALDYFKSAQSKDVNEGDWTMAAVNESAVPPPHRAKRAFEEAMQKWDVEAADAAIAGYVRSAGANQVFESMAHYGCRDFRSIGHKAIYVANGFRTLQCIGWRYAEPVLRSLTYALLNHTGEPNPSTSDLAADRAIRVTEQIVDEMDSGWNAGKVNHEAAIEHLQMLRQATPEDAVRETAKLIQSGVHPQSISDALFLSAGEMVMQQPAIVALHSATSTNALQYAYRTVASDQNRMRLLLQNAAFIPHFRQAMDSRGKVGDSHINKLTSESSPDDSISVEQIFDAVGQDRSQAATATFRYLESEGKAEELIHAARQLTFLKGNDSHDYKYSSAALEDYYAVSPELRNRYFAAATYLMPGKNDRDNSLVNRVREALA